MKFLFLEGWKNSPKKPSVPGTVLREKSLKLFQYLTCFPIQKSSISSRFNFSNLYFPRKFRISSSYSKLFAESSIKCSLGVFMISSVFMVSCYFWFCVCTLLSSSTPTFLFIWLGKLWVTYFVLLGFLNKLMGLLHNSAIF